MPERDFQEWLDAYWAKDIQELFRLERRAAFQRLFELLLAQSGGMFEATQARSVMYWRDKQHHEVDFVLPRRGRKSPVAIECKWRAADFDPGNLGIFRRAYPNGENFAVIAEPVRTKERSFGNLQVRFVELRELQEPAAL